MDHRPCHVVALQQRQAGEAAAEILRNLTDYFQVTARGSSVWIGVDRGLPSEAPLRVATVLNEIDGRWERHFELPPILVGPSV
jgi:hypothetical protein